MMMMMCGASFISPETKRSRTNNDREQLVLLFFPSEKLVLPDDHGITSISGGIPLNPLVSVVVVGGGGVGVAALLRCRDECRCKSN